MPLCIKFNDRADVYSHKFILTTSSFYLTELTSIERQWLFSTRYKWGCLGLQKPVLELKYIISMKFEYPNVVFLSTTILAQSITMAMDSNNLLFVAANIITRNLY